jgi:hypothetical protein
LLESRTAGCEQFLSISTPEALEVPVFQAH